MNNTLNNTWQAWVEAVLDDRFATANYHFEDLPVISKGNLRTPENRESDSMSGEVDRGSAF